MKNLLCKEEMGIHPSVWELQKKTKYGEAHHMVHKVHGFRKIKYWITNYELKNITYLLTPQSIWSTITTVILWFQSY